MKTKKITLSIQLLLLSIVGFGQQHLWSGQIGGVGEDVIRDMYVDAEGNSYMTGYFTDVSDMDPSDEVFELTSNGGFDVFITKTNSQGDLVWAKSIGGEGYDYGTSITADEDGNVYISGYYSTEIDADPGEGELLLPELGGGDIFIIKLNADGDFCWGKYVGGTDYEESNNIVVDNLGHVFIVGYFYNEVDFNPPMSYVYVSKGGSDTFILKLSTEDGSFAFACSYGGEDIDLVMDATCDHEGNLILGGYFEGSPDMNPHPIEEVIMENSEDFSSYVLKLNNQLEFDNVIRTEGGKAEAYSVDVDAQGNMYLSGKFGLSVNFNDAIILSSSDTYNGFIAKYNSNGDCEWAQHIVSDDFMSIFDMKIDNNGNVVTTGYFTGNADFDPDIEEEFVVEKSTELFFEAYISLLGADGDFKEAYTFGGCNVIEAHKLGIDEGNSLYFSGHFDASVDVNPLIDEDLTISTKGFRDNYIIKMQPEYLDVNTIETSPVALYPNPCKDFILLKGLPADFKEAFRIYDLAGRVVLSGEIDGASSKINLNSLHVGIYTLNIGETYTQRLVLVK